MAALALCLATGALAACGSDDPKLKVTSIEPPRGASDGTSYIHIYGNRFLTDANGNDAPSNAKIYFGGTQGKITRFPNDGEMIVQAPAGKAGDVVDLLIVFEGRGEITIPKAFTYYDKAPETQMNVDTLTKQPAK
jgi:hypothetical protein